MEHCGVLSVRAASSGTGRRRSARHLRVVDVRPNAVHLFDQGRAICPHHVREDALSLYGFATKLEQELFERLISISGIGPKVALAVLSGIEPPELLRAIERSDLARLTAIPGVGKKTSERIVLELKDRLPKVHSAATIEEQASSPSAMRDDVLSALMNLGYHRPLAEKAVDSAIKATAGGDFERTLKQALRELAR